MFISATHFRQEKQVIQQLIIKDFLLQDVITLHQSKH
jgi:hypothetical protein